MKRDRNQFNLKISFENNEKKTRENFTFRLVCPMKVLKINDAFPFSFVTVNENRAANWENNVSISFESPPLHIKQSRIRRSNEVRTGILSISFSNCSRELLICSRGMFGVESVSISTNGITKQKNDFSMNCCRIRACTIEIVWKVELEKFATCSRDD